MYQLMTKTIISIFILFIVGQNSNAQDASFTIDTTQSSIDPAKADKAKLSVTNFVNNLFSKNDIAVLVDNCLVPFAMDGKKIISTKTELRDIFKKIKTQSGTSQTLQIDTTYVIGTLKKIINGVIPIDIYFVIVVINSKKDDATIKKSAVFAVQITDETKLIGFNDAD
jgi:hypothetical protein